jgi:hypothetical protein
MVLVLRNRDLRWSVSNGPSLLDVPPYTATQSHDQLHGMARYGHARLFGTDKTK